MGSSDEAPRRESPRYLNFGIKFSIAFCRKYELGDAQRRERKAANLELKLWIRRLRIPRRIPKKAFSVVRPGTIPSDITH